MEITWFAGIFFLCCFAVTGSLWIYSKSENNTYKKTLDSVNEVRSLVLKQDQLVQSHNSSIVQIKQDLKRMEEKIICFTGVVDKGQESIDDLQEHCARLREEQISIKDKISSKRPIIKFESPVPVEIIEQAKKVKRQMKDLGL